MSERVSHSLIWVSAFARGHIGDKELKMEKREEKGEGGIQGRAKE